MYLSICLSIYLFIDLSIYLSFCPPLSENLSLYIRIHIHFQESISDQTRISLRCQAFGILSCMDSQQAKLFGMRGAAAKLLTQRLV